MSTIWKCIHLKLPVIATDENITISVMWELGVFLCAWINSLIRINLIHVNNSTDLKLSAIDR